MKLSTLLASLKNPFQILGKSDFFEEIDVEDLAIDSRLVVKNSAFFAFAGSKTDGMNFVFDAANRGASAIFLSFAANFAAEEFSKKFPKIAVFVGDNFAILTEILEIFYQPKPARIYAITGTNGKTSVAEYTRQILQILGKNSASIGTLGINCHSEIAPQLINSSLTTPDIISLHKNLNLLKQNAVDDVAIEVSSIGLHQNRIAGIKIKVASFTNFTQDHLDYHGDMASYFAAKMLLFERALEVGSVAVLNSDIPEFLQIKKICKQRMLKIIDYGRLATNLCLISFESGKLKFDFEGEIFEFEMTIEGEFQAYNMLCAIGNVIAGTGLAKSELREILPNLSKISAAKGRLQKIGEITNGAKIFVDFAHSPDAIANVLKAARKISKARVLILLGCGGDRDAKKRPIMGKIASELADLVIITDDNPRKESPAQIRQEILAGISKEFMHKIIEISDRKTAILEGIKMLQTNDLLILAGKGHEKYQIIGLEKFPFDEEKIVADAIKQRT